MAAAYDKYDPISGGFRALLNADMAAMTQPIAVSLNTTGKVVAGTGGQTGLVGVLMLDRAMRAGDQVDVMTNGEIVNITGITAGQPVTALNTTGALGTTAADSTHLKVGWTVEASRLIVRIGA